MRSRAKEFGASGHDGGKVKGKRGTGGRKLRSRKAKENQLDLRRKISEENEFVEYPRKSESWLSL